MIVYYTDFSVNTVNGAPKTIKALTKIMLDIIAYNYYRKFHSPCPVSCKHRDLLGYMKTRHIRQIMPIYPKAGVKSNK